MPPGERLPEHHADGPDVGRAGGVVAREALGRDVRERAGDVALRGERLGFGHAREAEVENPDGYAPAVGEQDIRGLDVPVQDSGPVCMGEAVADLRAGLDRGAIVELTGAERLPERATRHEFVRDVDVAGIPRERVGAEAARMAQLRGRLGFPLGACGGLPLAGDDLEGDLEPRLLVPHEPDRPRAAAAERAQRPVPAEHEPAPFERESGIRHTSGQVGDRRVVSSLTDDLSTVAARMSR